MPRAVKRVLSPLIGWIKINHARRAFSKSAVISPRYLPGSDLAVLMRNGYRQPDVIRYDPEGLEIRAEEKVEQIKKRIPLEDCRDCLELGCWDGMVSLALSGMGKTAYGLDISDQGFDPRARERGVRFLKGDVHAMPIADDSMDLVYSFAAFEHFENPDKVLSESYRVLRKGGFLYLLFGPVYTSPYGRHVYRQIPVPYCHYLFKEEDLEVYANENNLERSWPYVNGVSVTEYRSLWEKYRSQFETVYYKEHPTGGVGAELISRYPFCFKGKVPSSEDLFVSAIEIVWRKKF